MAADQQQYVGWQFRYVFEGQGDRRSAWSTVLDGEPSFTSGYRSYNGWQRHYYHEVRRVYAAAVEPYVEDPHHKPATPGAAVDAPICGNCDTVVPPGCAGLFKDDGTACALNCTPGVKEDQRG